MEQIFDTAEHQPLTLPIGSRLEFHVDLVRKGYQYIEIKSIIEITPSYIVYNALCHYADTNKAEELLVYEDFQVYTDKRGNDGKQKIVIGGKSNDNYSRGFTDLIIEREFGGRRRDIIQLCESYGDEYGLYPSFLRANGTRYYIPSIRQVHDISHNGILSKKLNRVKQVFGKIFMSRKNIVLIIALLISGGSLCFLHMYREKKLHADELEKAIIEFEKQFVKCFPIELSDSFPIKVSTTKITCQFHTNSGMARYSDYQIFKDSLVWNYYEARNHCHLKDLCKYDRADYDTLLNKLSKLKFSGSCNLKEICVGGAGYNYSFEENSQCYLNYNDSYLLSGKYQEVDYLLNHFIETHKTQCEILFEKYSKEPHEQALFGEFKNLPRKLHKYIVR